MKTFLTSSLIALFALGAVGFSTDADAAKRFGGGKSTGMQRESVKKDVATPPKAATPPVAAPAAAAAAPAAMAAPKTGMAKWLGPLAGLAAGGLLASMLMGGGFDGLKILDMLMMAGIAFALFMLVRAFMQKRAAAAGGSTGNGGNGMQYAGAGTAAAGGMGGSYAPPAPVSYAPPADASGRIVAPVIGSGLASGHASVAEIEAATINPRIPSDFDVVPFERQAQSGFIRLQAANDAKDLNDIRDFTTPEMFAEISLQMSERGNVAQRTEVSSLAVHVLEVTTENNRAVASVRYSGAIRDASDPQPEAFDEVWHVVKDLSDKDATWRIAGIQQLV